jgi:hypothetical protein
MAKRKSAVSIQQRVSAPRAKTIVLSRELRPTRHGAFGLAVSRRGRLRALDSLGMVHDSGGHFRLQIIVVPVRTGISN